MLRSALMSTKLFHWLLVFFSKGAKRMRHSLKHFRSMNPLCECCGEFVVEEINGNCFCLAFELIIDHFQLKLLFVMFKIECSFWNLIHDEIRTFLVWVRMVANASRWSHRSSHWNRPSAHADMHTEDEPNWSGIAAKRTHIYTWTDVHSYPSSTDSCTRSPTLSASQYMRGHFLVFVSIDGL